MNTFNMDTSKTVIKAFHKVEKFVFRRPSKWPKKTEVKTTALIVSQSDVVGVILYHLIHHLDLLQG